MRFSDRQREFALAGLHPGRWRLASGPRQCGKTESGIAGFCQEIGRKFSGHLIVLGAKRQPQMDNNVLARIDNWAFLNRLPGLARARGRKKTWTLPSYHGPPNYLVEVLGTDSTEAAAKAIQGLPVAGAYFDEFTNMPMSLIDMVLGGMLTVDDACFWGTMNPDNPLHPARVEVIDKVLDADDPDMDGVFCEFKMTDNPIMTARSLRQTAAKYSGVYFKRMISGEWAAADGIVYKLHAVNVGTMPAHVLADEWVVAIDYGKSSVTGALLLGWTGDAVYVTAELVLDMTTGAMTDLEQATVIADWAAAEVADSGAPVVDSWIVPWDGQSLGETLTDTQPGDVYQAFQPEKQGLNFAGLFIDGKYRPRLIIDKDACPELYSELLNLKMDAAALKRGVERIDKSTANGGHLTDAFRYGLATPEAKSRGINYEKGT